jgi:hypothetical protein
MALLTETNAQYYSGQQVFTGITGTTFTWTGDTELIITTSSTNINFSVLKNGTKLNYGGGAAEYTASGNVITLGTALIASDVLVIQLDNPARWANNGSYSYIKMKEIINNFLVAYVGTGKLIPSVKRTDVMFHAKRGLQEFSYDTLKSIKSQELTIPPSLSIIIPQDYVNYVKMSWVDNLGIKHIIYPTTLTSNPYTVPLQDTEGVPTQDNTGENTEAAQSQTNERWSTANDRLINGLIDEKDLNNGGVYSWKWEDLYYGRRYGLDPVTSQKNGWFTINEREGTFSFSSDLKDKLIILEYISDGLSVDYDMRIPKMAEEAMYMHIAYSILAGRSGVPEYIINRFKKDRRAALRNAKIRLSEIKLDQFIQVMRGKSKWIKH